MEKKTGTPGNTGSTMTVLSGYGVLQAQSEKPQRLCSAGSCDGAGISAWYSRKA
ncbi:MAG: hypothetical protein HY795_12490 [Desulfovibrio sp.]|nr:hypothetical protein [Desulfovibrio sp.]MBI4960302.1 hypothetical protein [Desulfovibrio sp.]